MLSLSSETSTERIPPEECVSRCLEGRMLRDVGSAYKLPLPTFSDGDGDWSLWSATFETNVELAGWSTVLSMAASQVAPISVTGPTAKSIRLIKIIYAVLLTKTEEKTFNLVHLTPRRAGAEFWRLLRAEYCGISAARLAAMARKLICPREARPANATAKCDFLTSLSLRKIHATAYEVACGDKICRVRVAMLLHHVPEPVNTSLCEAHLEQQSVLSSLGSVRRDGRPSLPWQKKRRQKQKAKAKGEGKRRRPKAKAKGKGTG